MSKANKDNRANQLNDNNSAYWKSRENDKRPYKVEHCEPDVMGRRERREGGRNHSE